MDKVIKFNKIGFKRRFIHYIIIILFSASLILLAFKIIQKRKIAKIKIYNSQIEKLQSEKQEKIKAIEKEYDEKIEQLLLEVERISR